ncbi:MAG: helix-turn-helix domain-containing protein [Oscillospiraceae bacterium]|nr:helix-turn-helix domain-containing protein [Oscillospiraceae bacterium]
MKLYFGESVRRLRLAAGLTQEQLAQRLHVTFQTISKWERNESYPDITMLPALAGLFNVKVDELLGVNQAENEQRVQEIMDMYDKNRKTRQERLAILKAAVAEFPLDYRILVRYLECLLGARGPGLKASLAVEKEVREIYENIVEHCKDDSIRIRAKRGFVQYLHQLARPFDPEEQPLGNPARQEECEKILAEMPSLMTSREHIATLVTMPGEPQLRAVQEKIQKSLWLLTHAIGRHGPYVAHPGDESTYANAAEIVYAHEIEMKLIALIYPDGDYGIQTWHIIYTSGYLAFYHSLLSNFDAAFEHLNRAIAVAREFDAQPQIITHTSPLLAGLSYDKTCCDQNHTKRLECLFADRYPWPEEFREDPRFQQYLNFSQET